MPSEQQIRRAVLSQALQHPFTEIPLALACVAALYLALYHPVLGLGTVAFGTAWIVLALSLLAGAVSFVWLYILNFAKSSTEISRSMRQQREQAELDQIRSRLVEGFTETRLAEGHYILRDLDSEFKQLQTVIARHRETDSLSLTYLPALVDETFRQGLFVLDDVLELARATSARHDRRLEAEIKRLREALDRVVPVRSSMNTASTLATSSCSGESK